jgi:hypothetical protein
LIIKAKLDVSANLVRICGIFESFDEKLPGGVTGNKKNGTQPKG